MRTPTLNLRCTGIAAAALLAAPLAPAQQAAATQRVDPPLAQAWIDVATQSAAGLPEMGGLMSTIGGLLGGASNSFGRTHVGPPGRWLDVTVYARTRPALAEAQMAVATGTQLAPTLALVAPRSGKAPEGDDEPLTGEPVLRGKVSLYWGCGEAVRAGQPRTVDLAQAQPADLMQVFRGRRATQRGAHAAPGRPSWPNDRDARLLPEGATLVGQHGFNGEGLPADWRFNLPAAQDLMPPLAIAQADVGGATRLSWPALPTARAYFVAAMGSRADDPEHMVLWTSSERPDSGFGLMDYQTNAAVDRWLDQKVLLPPGATECTVPRGVFSEGAMLRAIAYGTELNLAHPPRPTDPRTPWSPQWAVKVRVKSQSTGTLGLADVAEQIVRQPDDAAATPGQREEPASPLPKARDVLRGIFGR